jgi:hypothetical protein
MDTVPGEELNDSEREELMRLRAEADRRSRRGARAGRWVGACALMVVAALLGTAAVTAAWLRSEVLDTGRYVETVAPLASDPAVQEAVAARLSDEVATRLDLQGLATSLVQALEDRGAPQQLSELVPPIVSGIRSFLNDKIHGVVTSEQFAEFWTNANRTAHQEVQALLTGQNGKLVSADNTAIVIDLGQVLEMVKQRLVDAGFTAAQRIPQQSIPYTVAQVESLPKLQRATRLLNTAAWVLPLLTLIVGALAVAAAPNRRRGLLVTMTVFAAVLLVALGVLAFARERVLSNLPDTVRSPAAAAVLWDTVIRFLIAAIKTLIVICLIVILATLLSGPSRAAHAIRHGLNWLLDAAANGLGRLGLTLGSVPSVLARNRVAIRVGLVVLAVMSLIIWRRPGIEGTIGVTLITLAVLALVEIVARLPGRRTPVTA